jgi:hypothetical protein
MYLNDSQTFFGLDESVFKALVQQARDGSAEVPEPLWYGLYSRQRDDEMRPLPDTVSLLRDGSMLSPLEMLEPLGPRQF